MSCYTADIVVVVAILVCSYYMQRECFRDTLCAQSHSEDTSEGEGSAVEEVVHAARVCSFDGLSVNILVLELAYSGLRPIENSDPDVLGDRILDNLFDVCYRTMDDHVQCANLPFCGGHANTYIATVVKTLCRGAGCLELDII